MSTITKHPTTESTRGQLGQGIYSLAELQLYLAFHGTAEDGDRALYWLTNALNPIAHTARQPDYSFGDLISLLVVRELVDLGVKLRRIREGEAYMRQRFELDRPFVTEEVATDGVEVFTRSDHADQVESANRGGGQQVPREIIGPSLHQVEYEHGRAVSWTPADEVVLDPEVQFGEPVVEGTRVPTAAVADIAKAAGLTEAASRLAISTEHARRAIGFERKLERLRG